jgi:hypothetical protein
VSNSSARVTDSTTVTLYLEPRRILAIAARSTDLSSTASTCFSSSDASTGTTAFLLSLALGARDGAIDAGAAAAVAIAETDGTCDGTSQVIRPTYSCPCLTDIRHPVDVPKSLDKLGIFPYLTRNVSPVLQTLQTSEIKKCGSNYINLHLFQKQA